MTRTASSARRNAPAQLAPHAKRPLGTGPHGQLPVVPSRDGRSRLERRMGDVGDRVGLLEADVRGFEAFLHRSASLARVSPSFPRLASLPLQVVEEVLAGDLRTGLPLRLDRGQRTRGLYLARRGDADKFSVADHDHVRHRLWPRWYRSPPGSRRSTGDAVPCRTTSRGAGCRSYTDAARSRTSGHPLSPPNGRRSSTFPARSSPDCRRRPW